MSFGLEVAAERLCKGVEELELTVFLLFHLASDADKVDSRLAEVRNDEKLV